MLKFFARRGMVVEKFHEIISFKQSNCLEKHISFTTQKRNRAKNDFEKDFFKLLANAAFGKFVEKVRNRLIIDFNKNCDYKKLLNNNQN